MMPTSEELKGVLQHPWMEGAPSNEINRLLQRFVEERRVARIFDEVNRVQQQLDKQGAATLPWMCSEAASTKSLVTVFQGLPEDELPGPARFIGASVLLFSL